MSGWGGGLFWGGGGCGKKGGRLSRGGEIGEYCVCVGGGDAGEALTM